MEWKLLSDGHWMYGEFGKNMFGGPYIKSSVCGSVRMTDIGYWEATIPGIVVKNLGTFGALKSAMITVEQELKPKRYQF